MLPCHVDFGALEQLAQWIRNCRCRCFQWIQEGERWSPRLSRKNQRMYWPLSCNEGWPSSLSVLVARLGRKWEWKISEKGSLSRSVRHYKLDYLLTLLYGRACFRIHSSCTHSRTPISLSMEVPYPLVLISTTTWNLWVRSSFPYKLYVYNFPSVYLPPDIFSCRLNMYSSLRQVNVMEIAQQVYVSSHPTITETVQSRRFKGLVQLRRLWWRPTLVPRDSSKQPKLSLRSIGWRYSRLLLNFSITNASGNGRNRPRLTLAQTS